jgi:hypothetical protein
MPFRTDHDSRVRQATRGLVLWGACLASSASAQTTRPFFAFRGWETQVDGLWCGSRGGSAYWYKNGFYLDYLDRVLREAPTYGANALILMGRGDFAEIHTFVTYRKWPLLHDLYKERGLADRELQVQRLNGLITRAASQGVASICGTTRSTSRLSCRSCIPRWPARGRATAHAGPT